MLFFTIMSKNRYNQRGVSADKEDIHKAIENIDKGLFRKAFCKIVPDYLSGDDDLLANLYQNATALIYPSKYEGFGNVLVEAAMFKLKIISSDCNSGPREILLNGKGGKLFKIGDHIDLASKILNSLKSNDKKSENRLYNSLNRFNINRIANKYINLFKKI